MPKSSYAISILAALAFGSAAFAQTATEETPAAPADATQAEQAPAEQTTGEAPAEDAQADAPADDAQADAPATDAPAEGAAEGAAEGTSAFNTGREVNEDPTYIKEEHGDWQLRCFRNAEGEDPCQMYQLLKEAAGNPIAEFSIFRIAEGGPAVAGATIIVPLLTMLPEELKIAVDGGAAKSYPYRFCSPAGCIAQVGFTEQDIAAYKRGAKARLTLVPAQAPDQKVNIDVSLSGFTAAFDKVSVFSE